MPIYEYRCRHCGSRFEKLVRLSQATQPISCPSCGADDAERLLSTFAAQTAGSTPSTTASCSTGGG